MDLTFEPVLVVGISRLRKPLTVQRIVDKLAELSDGGTKAVCLTCNRGEKDLERKDFAHDHSREITSVARAQYRVK